MNIEGVVTALISRTPRDVKHDYSHLLTQPNLQPKDDTDKLHYYERMDVPC